MTYIAVGEIHGGDVENMLLFCRTISGFKTPRHIHFLEQKLFDMLQMWPVYLDEVSVHNLLESTYELALQKHRKLKSPGPFPNRVRLCNFKTLKYNTVRSKITITLDMSRGPALLSFQGYFYSVQKYAEKAGVGPVIAVEDNNVLLPSQMLNIQISLGTALRFFRR